MNSWQHEVSEIQSLMLEHLICYETISRVRLVTVKLCHHFLQLHKVSHIQLSSLQLSQCGLTGQ